MCDSDKTVECDTHGEADAAFVCQHLVSGEKLGFNLGYDPDEPDDLYPDAWCDECEKVWQAEGEWNDKSEAFTNIKVICAHCYEDIRERNWLQDDEKWNDLVSSSCQLIQERQEEFLNKFKVDEYDRWDRDQETGILIFSHDGEPQVEAEFHFAGSFSKKSNTWMWAWANESFGEPVRTASRKVREQGDEQGFLSLSAHLIDTSEEDAGHFAAIMVKKLDAIGTYRTTEDDLISYMVLTKARWVNNNRLTAPWWKLW